MSEASHGTHDLLLVGISILIAVIASYVALDFAAQARRSSRRNRYAWSAAALAMGGGIWAMHFVGMLGFRTPTGDLSYGLGLTALSLALPILGTGAAFFVVSHFKTPRALVGSGVLMGLSVAAMHYTGMAALSIAFTYEAHIVALSVLIAIGASVVALWLALTRNSLAHQLAGAAAMGAAVSGMHYTGMAAMVLEPSQGFGTGPLSAGLSQSNVAFAVAATTVFILILALAASLVERRRASVAEQMAAASAHRLGSILESTTDCVFVLDRSWRFTYLNQRAVAEISGGRDLIGQTIWSAFPEAVQAPFWDAYHKSMEERVNTSLEVFYEPLGRWYEFHACPTEEGIAVFFRNTTEQRAAHENLLRGEAQMREQEGLLKTTLENMDQGLIMVDGEETVRVYNKRVLELLDLPEQIMQGPRSYQAVKRHQRERGEFARSDPDQRQWLDTGDFLGKHVHYERERPSGTVLEVRSDPLPGGGAVRTFTDITARKRAEEALRKAEERARDFANIASDWFWETDADFRFISIVGATPAPLDQTALGKTAWEAVEANPNITPWKDHLVLLQAHEPFRDFEYSLRTPRGRVIWITSSAHPLFDEQGQFIGYRGISTNITQRKRSEEERESLREQLQKSQKMQAVGQLTGGISHDFNNLLTVILGNAEILAESPADPALTRSLAEQILYAAERGADLNQKLLAFGRRQSLKPEKLRLEQVVKEVVPLLERSIGEQIEVEVDLHSATQYAVADRTLLESAIVNLAVNARDAMPQGGTLTITTGEGTAGPDEGALPLGQPVMFVTVSDTGTGMPPEVLSRAFEPFFTTKDVGKGSGLGLSMVYGFAEQSAGHVSIKSKVGEGTAVTIVLPAVGGEAPSTSVSKEEAPPEAGRGRLLVVEDEPQVLQFVSSQLVSLGYEVTTAANGQDALDLLKQGREFDLLFTDVVMPKGISGVDLAQQARSIRPGLKVLLTSGYAEEAFEHHGRPAEGTRLLRKPYKRRELARMLREALSAG